MVSNDKTIRIIALLAGIVAGAAMTGIHADDGADFARPLKVEYERPGTDYSKYHALLINDLDVSNTKIVPPPWKTAKPFKWEISDKNVGALQTAFHQSMREKISANGGYPIVTEPGPGVMEISLRIVSFMPYADRKEKVTTRGSGEMRIHVEVRAAQSEELLSMYADPREGAKDDLSTGASPRQ